MKLIINENVYEMTRKQVNGVIKIARKRVVQGIFAVEKRRNVFLKNETFDSLEELDIHIKEYEEQGFKVYYRR